MSGAAISILLARHFGAEQLGQWSVGLVYANFVGTVVEGGLDKILMRDASQNPELLGRALGRVLKGRLYLGLLAVPCVLVAAAVIGGVKASLFLVVLLVISRWIEGIQASYQSTLYTLGDFRTPNLIETGRRLVRLLLVGSIIFLGGTLFWAAVAFLVTAIFSNSMLVARTGRRVKVDFSGNLRDSWREAIWFWAGGVLFWITSEISLLMLSRIAGDHATGQYAAAIRLSMLVLILPRAVNNSIVPKLFKSSASGQGLGQQLGSSAFFLAAIGGVILVESHAVGRELIALVYGAAFEEAGVIYEVTALFVFVTFLRVPANWYLGTSGRVRSSTIGMGLASLCNVGANFLLIPRLGALGAAWAAVFSESVLALGYMIFTVKVTGPRLPVATVCGLLFAVLAWPFHLLLAPWMPWFVVTPIVGVVMASGLALIARRILAGGNPLGLFGELAPKV